MGLSSSRLLPEELQELQEISDCNSNPMHAHFLKVSVPEITRLYKRFKTLDKENKSRVSIAELMSIPELAMNPLSNRILAVFDSTESSDFNFKEFLSCLSVFSPHAKRETKLKCL